MGSIKKRLKFLGAKMLALLLPPQIMRDKDFFNFWENRGYHVTPVHYYEPIPDTRKLPDKLWESSSTLPGLQVKDEVLLNRLFKFTSHYKKEYEKFPEVSTGSPNQFFLQNVSFKSVDAEILYCMIREFKPRRIIEIGSGYTTYLEAQAIWVNKAEDRTYHCRLTAIEPYPNPVLKNGFPGLSELVEKPVQEVALKEFDELEENDILFIDSSHVVRIGGDVVYEYLEVLPRLKKGVFVHVHDIFMPHEYPKNWVFNNRLFWSEQYLLQAFMAFNDSFEIIWAGSYMNAKYPEKLEEAIPSYVRNTTQPGSFWIKKIH